MATADEGTSAGSGVTTTGDVHRAFDFSATDFATIVTTTAYVDKSLMIRDFYNASSRILITAPPRFGKSTNLDMVKRFFEIEVDARGNPKPVHTTNNYKLFKDNNLEISKDIGFLNEHFGKHPVVYIDFKPLGGVHDSAEILGAFKTIVENSLNQHSYILQNCLTRHDFSGIAGFNVNHFRKYISDGIIKDVDGLKLADSFKHLSTILNKVFGKKVFALIDSYDSFLDSFVIKNKTDRKKIMSFVESSVARLLNNLNCIDRVLITGVIPVIGDGFLSSENNIECCYFLDEHAFTKYYGLTSNDLETVFRKFTERDEGIRSLETSLGFYYGCYVSRRPTNIWLYNVWSTLQFICKRRVQSYWCERRRINKVKKCFKIEPIRQKLEELLFDNELDLDISQPLSITDVLKVNSTITNVEDNEDEHLSIEVEFFFVLLYHSGYLSISGGVDRGVVKVKIPNEEIKYELAKAVFDENRQFYDSSHVDDILSALDAFHPHTDLYKRNLEKFIINVFDLYKNNNFYFTHIIECLFINLARRAERSRVVGRKLEFIGSKAVLLQSKYGVAICVMCDGCGSAESVHKKFTNKRYEQHIFHKFDNARGKVIIAIGSRGEIAYSDYFKTGDNLCEIKTLPNNRTH